MDSENFKRDIEILMADQDVQFKLKKLEIWHLSNNQIHILDWLLLKSPNLIDLHIRYLKDNMWRKDLEIKSELNIKKLKFSIRSEWAIHFFKELIGRAQSLVEIIYLHNSNTTISLPFFEALSHLKSLKSLILNVE